MDFSRWPPLIAAVLAMAIAVKVILRPAKRREHWFFIAFAANVAVWYLATFLAQNEGRGSWLDRLAGLAAAAPAADGRAFPLRCSPARPRYLPRPLGRVVTVPALALVASPWYGSETFGAPIRAGIPAYAVGLLPRASRPYTRRQRPPPRDRRDVAWLIRQPRRRHARHHRRLRSPSSSKNAGGTTVLSIGL
ncbi:MAG: hypothetical protein R3A52_27290 [Polyangiales bacterium]